MQTRSTRPPAAYSGIYEHIKIAAPQIIQVLHCPANPIRSMIYLFRQKELNFYTRKHNLSIRKVTQMRISFIT